MIPTRPRPRQDRTVNQLGLHCGDLFSHVSVEKMMKLNLRPKPARVREAECYVSEDPHRVLSSYKAELVE